MLRNWLHGAGGRLPFRPVDPEAPFSAIGDIHGRADLLKRALAALEGRQIVCVGDYVDRGQDSAEVLRILHARPDLICLSGNHEEMMLGFLDEPEEYGRHWLRYGGVQTLASFGIFGVHDNSDLADITNARDELHEAMGTPLMNWIRSLPTHWQSGNVAVVHGGADPDVAVGDQTRETLHWGHPQFFKRKRTDGVWIVHGHTIVDRPRARNGRIEIDTGAFFTGRLTVAHVNPHEVSFETFS